MIRLFVFAATTTLVLAQPPGPSIGMPSLGYVFDDNSKSIRLISGVPGAASLDSTVAAGTGLDSAFVHSRARIAIANGKDGGVVLVRWTDTALGSALNSALGHITLVAFSRSGDRAAISDGSALEVWSGLTGTATVGATFNLDGGVSAAAITDSGAVAAANGSGAVMLLGDNTRVLASGGSWTALAFLPNGNDLLATDSAAQTLTLIQDVQNAATSSIVVSLSQKPGALVISADGSWAALGLADNVTVVNLSSGAATSIACGCQAARFDPLAGNLVARMIDAQTGAEWLLDADSAQPRLGSLVEMNLGAGQ